MSNTTTLRPAPHVRKKAQWIQAAAAQIARTAFNPAFIVEEIGDVIAKHAAPIEAKYRAAVNGLEEIVATHCDPRNVASSALKRCVELSSPNT